MSRSELRDAMIHQAQQERMTRDTVIMQKVNHAHRQAFAQRFPTQIQHCMRLTAERLQAILTSKPADLADPMTWKSSAADIDHLSQALYVLAKISEQYPIVEEKEQQ